MITYKNPAGWIFAINANWMYAFYQYMCIHYGVMPYFCFILSGFFLIHELITFLIWKETKIGISIKAKILLIKSKIYATV